MGVLEVIGKLYFTLLPVILAGVANSALTKSSLLPALKKPIDAGGKFFDGKRIFGDNKTWKGFLGYVVLGMLFTVIWGAICGFANWNRLHYIYQNHDNTLLFNLWLGFLYGFAWAFCELPNSFIKRRLDIKPGKNPSGLKRIFFIILDQADSIFGVCLVLWAFYPMSAGLYFLFVLVGAMTHIVFNMLLYFVGLRKNMF